MRSALIAVALALCACADNGDVCNSSTSAIGEVCVPDPLAPGINSNIEVRELCGRGCSDTPSCTAVFRNSQVVLDISQTNCLSQFASNCLAKGCLTRTIRCSLPELNAGDYPLIVPGGPPQILHVGPGGQSSCFLPDADAGSR